MIGLLDGDIVVFRCGFAAERNVWNLSWDPDPTVSENRGVHRQHMAFDYKKEALEHLDKVCPGQYSRVEGDDYSLWPERELEPLSHALHGVKRLVAKICEANDLNPETDLKVMLSPGGETFRHRVADYRPYKGNRKTSHRPTYEQEIRKYIIENYVTVIAVDEEADDLLAIEQTKLGPHDSIILSLDKDLDQVPGLKFNFMHDIGYEVTEEQAVTNFCTQLLTGDSTDNIVGLPKVGPAAAAKALHGRTGYDEMMQEVMHMYQMKAPVEDWYAYLKEMGQLVYIRRKAGEMWEPPEFDDDFGMMTEEELTL